MKRRQFTELKTTTREVLSTGCYIRYRWAKFVAHKQPWAWHEFDGCITKMEECESGILLHLVADDGATKVAHVNYLIPNGVHMHDIECTTTILRRAMRQTEIAA